MRFHFAAADLAEDHPHLTFYRVTVRGVSGMSTSHLLTGFYDANALHDLFGKVESPQTAATGGSQTAEKPSHSGSVVVEYDPASKSWRLVNDNERFTVFWGTNADAMAQQVGAFAEANQTGDDLAGLIAAAAGRDSFDALRNAQRAADAKESNRADLSDELKDLKKELDALSVPAANAAIADKAKYVTDLQSIVRRAAQAALMKAGSGVVLPDPIADAMKQAKLAADALSAANKPGVQP